MASAIAVVAVAATRHSEAVYLLMLVGGIALAWVAPLAGWALPLLWMAVVGTEFRPDLAGIAGPQVRMLDVLVAGVLVGRMLRAPIPRGWRPFSGNVLLVAALAVALAATPGGSPHEAAQTAHQLALIVVAALVAGEAIRSGDVDRLILVVLLAGGLAALKTAAVWVSGVDLLNGPESALQARSQLLPDLLVRRTILIGGSAFVAVAAAVGLSVALRRGRGQTLGGLVFVAALMALVMGMTRAYLAGAAVGGIMAVIFVLVRHRDRLVLPRASTVATVAACAWIAGLAFSWNAARDPLTGTIDRLISPEAESVSLRFRGSESTAILDRLDGARLIVGAGLGGQFQLDAPGLNPAGNGYAHSWVFWVLLKGGILALTLTIAGLGLSLARLLPWRRGVHDPAFTGLGVMLVVVLVASLGANLLPLAEGEWLLGTALAAAALSGRSTLPAGRPDPGRQCPPRAP